MTMKRVVMYRKQAISLRIEVIVAQTYLTTEELSQRIKYDVRTIRERLKDSVLLEGIHYLRPFGGRKILFIWERIEKDMAKAATATLHLR